MEHAQNRQARQHVAEKHAAAVSMKIDAGVANRQLK